jgi:hypothetical protein
VPVESKTKGTMILRCGGRFYKVLKLIKHEDSFYSFECRDLDKREDKILHLHDWRVNKFLPSLYTAVLLGLVRCRLLFAVGLAGNGIF